MAIELEKKIKIHLHRPTYIYPVFDRSLSPKFQVTTSVHFSCPKKSKIQSARSTNKQSNTYFAGIREEEKYLRFTACNPCFVSQTGIASKENSYAVEPKIPENFSAESRNSNHSRRPIKGRRWHITKMGKGRKNPSTRLYEFKVRRLWKLGESFARKGPFHSFMLAPSICGCMDKKLRP